MKKFLIVLCLGLAGFGWSQETVKSKALKLKYTLPQGWKAQEFGGKTSWEEGGGSICHCSGVLFSRQNNGGKMNVLVYPTTIAGLDSAKRNAVGNLRFEDVQKYEKSKNKYFSFMVKRSNFAEVPSGKRSYDVIRYFAKVDDHCYIIFAWQESMNALNSTSEKELYDMVNAIEPMD